MDTKELSLLERFTGLGYKTCESQNNPASRFIHYLYNYIFQEYIFLFNIIFIYPSV